VAKKHQVAASDPKALEILEANPKPVSTNYKTFLPAIAPLIAYQFDFFYVLLASICDVNK
jgi:hypothetical protein